MAKSGEDTIECGFCLRKNEALEEPKVLACTHVHCLKCLIGFYEVNHMIQCPLPTCRQVTEVQVNSLPSHDTSTYTCTQCDSCIKKGDDKKAVVYCIKCDSKYCTNHLKSHDDILEAHPRMNIEEYKVKFKRLEVRECTNHKGHQYSLGCKVCLTVCCVECLPEMDRCVNEKLHDLFPLGKLVASLVNEDIVSKMVAKEEKLESLFKLTSKVNSEYDVKTSEMVESLKRTRDEQLKVIKEKYDELEKELVEKRKKKRLELAEFIEDSVLKRWNELRNHRLKIESRLEHSHQVDVVKGYRELKDEVKQLIEDVLPRLDTLDVVELNTKAAVRAIELEIAPSDGISISSEEGFNTIVTSSLPTSMALLQTLKLSAKPLSVCQYKGDVYVGLDNKTVARVDSNYQVYESFIRCTGRAESVTVYKDGVYVLLQCSTNHTHTVCVYDMLGQKVLDWVHTTTVSDYCVNVLSIVSDELAIADHANNRITIYSLTGTVLRHISCSQTGEKEVAQCNVDNASIVISDFSACKVLRLNLASGEVMWTYSTSGNPLGIISYGRRYLIVTSHNSTTLQILDINTGEKISQLSNDKLAKSLVLGLATFGNIMVAANYYTKEVLFFEMRKC